MMASEDGTWTAWSQGGEAFAALVGNYGAGVLNLEDVKQFAEALFASPALRDWEPEVVVPEVVLMEEATVVAMLVQAWGDRAAWAADRTCSERARSNYLGACRVIHEAAKYLPSGRELSE